MARRFPRFWGLVFPVFLLLPVFTGSAKAQSHPALTPECVSQVDQFLADRLAVWQQRLSLADWKITVLQAHPSELKPKTLGNIHWDADKKMATIRVMDISDYQLSCRDTLDDMEFTIVHELIHLELSSLPRSEASRRDEEYAVNRLTEAYLKLDRKK
jgi:hypothetical protein